MTVTVPHQGVGGGQSVCAQAEWDRSAVYMDGFWGPWCPVRTQGEGDQGQGIPVGQAELWSSPG